MAEQEWITGNVRLLVNGLPVDMEMTVPAKPVKPHRMLPIFHQMANSFVRMSEEAAESSGETISCKAGCGACCRQPVPISDTEIYQISELVESMPKPRRSEIKKRFADAAEHFRSIGWFESMKQLSTTAETANQGDLMRTALGKVHEYFEQRVPCPFLENESCSIHEHRPVACREYLVTTPAENCSSPTAETVKVLALLIKPSHSLKRLGGDERLKKEGLITLVRALELSEKYPENFVERTGEQWMSEFFQDLVKHSKPATNNASVRTTSRKKRHKHRR